MVQSILLPPQIADKVNSATPYEINKYELTTSIEAYAKEVTLIGIILSDNYMKRLYKKSEAGYMFCIDQLHAWAKEFVDKYAYVDEWEEFCSTQTEFKNIMCWDDFVIAFGNKKFKEFCK